MSWCRKGYCCPWYGRRRFRKMVSVHLLIPLISSLCTCILLSCIVFTLLFGLARLQSSSLCRGFSYQLFRWLVGRFAFYVATLSFELATSSNVFFIIALLDSPRYICVEICTPDRYFRARLPGAPKVVSTPSADCTGNEKQSARVSTTCRPMAKVVIAFYSRYLSQTRTQFPQFPNCWPYLAPKWRN